MMKRISQLLLLILSVVGLSGCQQQVSLEEAATLFVQGEFYLRENYQNKSFTDSYAKAFGERITEATLWETETRTAVTLAKANVSPAIRNEVGPLLSKTMKKNTSFDVKKIDETTVSVTVNGLDLKEFKEILERGLEEELIKEIKLSGVKDIHSLEDLTNLVSSQELKEMEELVADFQADVLKQQQVVLATIPKMTKNSEPKSIEIKFLPQDKAVGQWKVENRDIVVKKLSEAMLN